MRDEIFKDDYNLEALTKIKPSADDFEMFVTPRFVGAYEAGYEVLSSRLVRAQLASCELFIDVGAHYGYYSILASKANPAIKIVSVEPMEENVSILNKNIELNCIQSEQITIINSAVSSENGTAMFFKSEASDNCSLYPHPSSGTLAQIAVSTVSLDHIISSHGASRIFIKTDTDGHDLEVLKGLAESLHSDREITILFEMNPKMLKIAGTSSAELLEYLDKLGFRMFAVDDFRRREIGRASCRDRV